MEIFPEALAYLTRKTWEALQRFARTSSESSEVEAQPTPPGLPIIHLLWCYAHFENNIADPSVGDISPPKGQLKGH